MHLIAFAARTLEIMERLTNDVQVTVVNNTGMTDFTIVVFAYNANPNAATSPFIAWHTISTQSRSEFVYPAKVRVGARFEDESVMCQSGPFDATPGSTWSIIQETKYSTPVLYEGSYYSNTHTHTKDYFGVHTFSSWGIFTVTGNGGVQAYTPGYITCAHLALAV